MFQEMMMFQHFKKYDVSIGMTKHSRIETKSLGFQLKIWPHHNSQMHFDPMQIPVKPPVKVLELSGTVQIETCCALTLIFTGSG